MNRHTLTHTHCGHVGYYNKLASTNIEHMSLAHMVYSTCTSVQNIKIIVT